MEAPFRLAVRPVRTPALRFTDNERNFLLTSGWVIGLVAAFQFFFWAGSGLLQQERLQDNFHYLLTASSEAAMRYVTLPHYIIGLLFMVTVPRNRTFRRQLLIVGLLVFSCLLCLGYAYLGTAFPNEILNSKTMRFYTSEVRSSQLAIAALFSYFLAHELRDQAMFYVATKSSGPIADQLTFDRFVSWLIALSLATFASAIWSFLALGMMRLHSPLPAELPGGLRFAIAFTPVALCVLGLGVSVRWYAGAAGQGVIEAASQHAPLFGVFAGVYVWLILGLAIGSGPCLIILFHVVGWYVFTCHKLKERGTASPAVDWRKWIRTTLPGFRVLHIGLVIALIAVGAVWSIAFKGQGPLWYVLSPAAFYYWTIAHITVSFLPR